MSAQGVLAARGISKAYSGSLVLDQVDFNVQRSEVVGLVGENGAGKSTLMNIISGVTRADHGEVVVNGEVARLRSYNDANRLGIFRVFQESALVPNLSVYENLLFCHEGSFERFGGVLDRVAMRRATKQILDEAKLDIDISRKAGDLSLAQRQALEIARATTLSGLLGIQHPIILLDEPTTALDAADERAMLSQVKRMKGAASFVLVSHRFEEIFAVTDRVYVLKDGRMVAEMATGEASPELLHRLMVGREKSDEGPRVNRDVSKDKRSLRLTVDSLVVPGALSGVSLELAAREIVGVCGLAGSGKELLGPAVVGVADVSHGTIALDGAVVRPTVRAMMAHGLVYVPGDRQLDGLILSSSIFLNLALASLHDSLSNALGLVKFAIARRDVSEWMDRLRIRAPSPRSACETLSGGQQQKVLFAKFLRRSPRILILENPTRGVDTGTKAEIYRLLDSLAADGAGILVISDDLPELLRLSDRIVVLTQGRVAGIVQSTDVPAPSEQALIRMMLGARGARVGDR